MTRFVRSTALSLAALVVASTVTGCKASTPTTFGDVGSGSGRHCLIGTATVLEQVDLVGDGVGSRAFSDHQKGSTCSADETGWVWAKEDLRSVLQKHHLDDYGTTFDCASSGTIARTNSDADWNVGAASSGCGVGYYHAIGIYGIYNGGTPSRVANQTSDATISNPYARSAGPDGPDEDQETDPAAYLANWQADIPNLVGDEIGPRGTIVPSEADARDARVSDLLPDRANLEPGTEAWAYAEALMVLDPVDVHDAEGLLVGYWTTRFIPIEDYPTVLTSAGNLLAAEA